MMKRNPSQVLLVVDPQLDFEPGGALAVPGGDEIMAGIAERMQAYQTVVLTQDFHPPGHMSFASSHPGRRPFEKISVANAKDGEQMLWPDHCVRGSRGADFDSRIPVELATLILRKGERLDADSYSAFNENDGRSTGLGAWMRDRALEEVHLVGLAADYCVGWSALDAIRLGFRVHIDLALTRFIEPDDSKRKVMIEAWRQGGIEIYFSA